MDKAYLKGIIQKILDKTFSSSVKRRIKDYPDRINFACPCCGDSGSSEHKKRGNLYINSLRYICYRCGEKMGVDRLCKRFDEQIDPDKKLEMIKHLDEVMSRTDYRASMAEARLDMLIDLSDLEMAFAKGVAQISEFKPIVKDGGIYKYLIGRGIDPSMHHNIYQAKYWKSEHESEWVIAMLNRREDKILGMQIRNLKEGKRRMFKIYNYENLLEWVCMAKDVDSEVDDSEMILYNKLSYYFNILNVDIGSPITVFEGYIDSLFFPNSLGLVGVNTDYRLLESSGLDLRYFYDNDDAGYMKAEEKIKAGFPVFLWKMLFEDIVAKKKPADPGAMLHRISKIKDMNKLSQLVNDPYSKLTMESFFSRDEFDLKWIPKRKRWKKDDGSDYDKKFRSFDQM
jgi:hypothetical protein